MAAPTAPEGLTVRHLVMLRSADSFAPTIPTGVVASSSGGVVTLTHDASSDPDGGTVGGSGVASYSYYRDGVLQETVAASPGLSLRLNRNEVGSITPLPSHTQSAATYTITSAGSGIETATPDEVTTLSSVVTGDVTIIAKLTSFANAGIDYCKAGLMIRAGTGQTDAYYAITQLGNIGLIQPRYRAATLGTSATDGVSVVNATYPVWLKLTRLGDTFTSYWSLDGNAWTLVHSTTIVMPAAVYAGLAVTSTTPGTNVTAQFQQVNVNNVSTVSWSQSYSGAGTYTVTATDRSSPPNTSAASAPVAISAGTMTWNPGYYVRSNGQPYYELLSSQLAEYDTIKSALGTKIKGIAAQFAWGDLERTKGDYSLGFTMIDAHIAKCAALGYKLILQLKTRRFGGTTIPSTPQTSARAVPDYLINEGQVFICNDDIQGEAAAIHRSYVMDRLLLLIAALGTRYNGNATVEAIEFGELSYNQSGDSQFTETNYMMQVNRLCDSLRTYFPNKACYPGINYVWSRTRTQEYAIRSMNAGNGMSGPDAITNDGDQPSGWPQSSSWGAYPMRGYQWNGAAYVPGLTDRYLEVPVKYEMQVIPNSGVSPTIYANFAADYLKCTHFIWTKYDAGTSFRTNPSCEWAGVQSYMNGAPRALRTAFPTRYTADGLTPVTN